MTDFELNPKKLLKMENVAKHVAQSTAWLVEQIRENHAVGVESAIDCNEPFLESPLEAIFLAWFHAVKTASYMSDDVDLHQQYAVELDGQKYRLDFAVCPGDVDLWSEAEQEYGLKWAGIAVELDGHDFHERTKEQVTYRNRRDRELVRAGWTVFHFSGSELHNHPEKCADEVYQHAWKQLINYQNAFRNLKTRRKRESR